MIDKTILNKIKLLEAEAEEAAIAPDDLYFLLHIPTEKVHKRSFNKSLNRGDKMAPMSNEAKLELINHWNMLAARHTPPIYMYWL